MKKSLTEQMRELQKQQGLKADDELLTSPSDGDESEPHVESGDIGGASELPHSKSKPHKKGKHGDR